jgi:hypothetical protein
MNMLKELLLKSNVSFSEIAINTRNNMLLDEMDTTAFVSGCS